MHQRRRPHTNHHLATAKLNPHTTAQLRQPPFTHPATTNLHQFRASSSLAPPQIAQLPSPPQQLRSSVTPPATVHLLASASATSNHPAVPPSVAIIFSVNHRAAATMLQPSSSCTCWKMLENAKQKGKTQQP